MLPILTLLCGNKIWKTKTKDKYRFTIGQKFYETASKYTRKEEPENSRPFG
jgi:hypothetical protein